MQSGGEAVYTSSNRAHQLADGLGKGRKVWCRHAVDLLHKLQRIERIAVRGRAMVPARYEYPAAVWQCTRLLHCPVGGLHSTSRCLGPGISSIILTETGPMSCYSLRMVPAVCHLLESAPHANMYRREVPLRFASAVSDQESMQYLQQHASSCSHVRWGAILGWDA